MVVLKYIFYLCWQSASTFEPDHVFLVVLPLAQGVLHCLFIGIMLSSQCYFKCPLWRHVWYAQFVWHSSVMEEQNIWPFSLRDKLDEGKHKDFLLFQYSSKFSLLFLKQEFQKSDHSTVCLQVLLFLLQHPHQTVPTSTAASL